VQAAEKSPLPFAGVGSFFAAQSATKKQVRQTTKPTTIIMKIFNPPAELAKRCCSRLLAAILLITGTLALLSATAVFAFHVLVPLAAIVVLGIIVARGVLHSLTGKIESLGHDLRRFSMETFSEGVKMAGQFARSSVAAFHPNPEAARENTTQER